MLLVILDSLCSAIFEFLSSLPPSVLVWLLGGGTALLSVSGRHCGY
ncbi:hypothetical protein RAC83_002433, partial [Xylella fastidiosa]|nr:hypothetical protein [Xylella fastidiosa]